MADFEIWCYQDIGEVRLSNEQLLELAEGLRDKTSIGPDYIKEHLKDLINYQDIEKTVEKDGEFKEKVNLEKTKYQKLAEQVETDKKQIEQEFDKSKYQQILSEIKKVPYANSVDGNSEEEIKSSLKTGIENEVDRIKKEVDDQINRTNQIKENYEKQYKEQYYQQLLSKLVEEGAKEIPKLEQFKELSNNPNQINEQEYKNKIQEIKGSLKQQVQGLYENYEKKVEGINKGKQKKIDEIQSNFEGFTKESLAQLEKKIGKQLNFDENYNFSSQQDVEEYLKNLGSSVQEILEKDYKDAMQEYQKAVENQENYKEKMNIDRKELANDILDKFEDELPVDTSKIKDELDKKDYNSIKDVEQAIKQELSKEQGIQNKFESGDFSDFFEQDSDSAENQGQGLSKEFYEMADSILKESLTNFDQKSKGELEKLTNEIENAEKQVYSTKNKLSYGAEKFIQETIEQTKKNQESQISKINSDAESRLNREKSGFDKICKDGYGFEPPTKIDYYFDQKISSFEKNIKEDLEKEYNKEIEKFNEKVKDLKKGLKNKFYDKFNIEQDYSEVFGEDISNQIITRVAENILGKTKRKIEEEHQSKLEKMTQKNIEYLKERDHAKDNLLKEYKDKAVDEIHLKYLDQLIERGLIEVDKDGKYEVNKERVTELLAKKAFDETMRILTGNRKSGRGTHKSKAQGFGEPVLDKNKRTNEVHRNLAILPTMKRSVVRRATKPRSPIITEEDLVEYDNLKNISYATVIAIDKSSSMEGKNIESAKNCALSLAHYMKKKHRKDKIDFVTFEDDVEEIRFEDILDLEPDNYTNTGGGIELGRKILDRYKRKEKLLYLITDGYPEGRSYSSSKERQEFALEQARKLKDDKVELVEILLNDSSSKRVYWGKKIVTEAKGTLFHVKDPSNLGAFVIDDFSHRRRGG